MLDDTADLRPCVARNRRKQPVVFDHHLAMHNTLNQGLRIIINASGPSGIKYGEFIFITAPGRTLFLRFHVRLRDIVEMKAKSELILSDRSP